MLFRANELRGYAIKSLDGDIGSAKDFLFDDRYWTVRYLVANTSDWFIGGDVLISPYSVGSIDTQHQHVSAQLTKKQIQDSPSADKNKPVSRQFESNYNGYYGYPFYWSGPYMWGVSPYIERDRSRWSLHTSEQESWDVHLRSIHEVTGYHLHALDGEIGHVSDFILDDDNWAIRYLVIATTNWWPGKKVLISPKWIENVSWVNRELTASLSRATIQDAPEFTDETLLTRDYEAGLYGHYDREGYWVDELAAV
jgi:hypothetical protein